MKTTLKAALLASVLGSVLVAQAGMAKDTNAPSNRSSYYNSERTVYNTNSNADVDARGTTYNNRGTVAGERTDRGYNHNRTCNGACWHDKKPTYTYGREAYADRIGGNDNDSNNRNRYLSTSSPSTYDAQISRVVKH